VGVAVLAELGPVVEGCGHPEVDGRLAVPALALQGAAQYEPGVGVGRRPLDGAFERPLGAPQQGRVGVRPSSSWPLASSPSCSAIGSSSSSASSGLPASR
jgi:hypothetical protein